MLLTGEQKLTDSTAIAEYADAAAPAGAHIYPQDPEAGPRRASSSTG